MRAPSDYLFQLIKSLSPSEKRHFKLYTRKDSAGGNNYIRLFNAIEKQSRSRSLGTSGEYDEGKIKELFKKDTIAKNLAIEKHYLYQIILESLNSYHRNMSAESTSIKLLHQAEILFNKGLRSQSLVVLERSKQVAIENEKFAVLPVIQSYESLFNRNNKKKTEEIFKEQKTIAEKYINRIEFTYLYNRIGLEVNQYGPSRKDADYRELETLFKNPLLKSPANALSFNSKVNYYSIHHIYHFTKNNYKKMLYFSGQLLDLYGSDLKRIEASPKGYLSSLHNYLDVCRCLKMWNEIIEKVKNVNNVSIKTPEIEVRKFYLSVSYPLLVFNAVGEHNKGILLAQEIEKGLKKYGTRLEYYYQFSLNTILASHYFGRAEFKKALSCQNRILNHPMAAAKEDIFPYSKIFVLLIYSELKDTDSLNHALISLYRYLCKKQRLYKFETVLINFIKKSSNLNVNSDLNIYFKKLRNELKELEKDPYEQNAFEYFDFISWIESKIEGRNFVDLLKEKAKIGRGQNPGVRIV